MGKRGPKPLPKALRLARGTHPELINHAEPMPPADNIGPPDWVTGPSRDKYLELAPQLAALRVLTNLDVDLLASYCVLHTEWRKHLALCQKGADLLLYRDSSGKVKHGNISPSAVLVGKLGSQLIRLAEQFGMSPSSRTQLVGSAGPEDSPLQAWLKKNNAGARA
jgi:P27 family predicted phage terminase small subunit